MSWRFSTPGCSPLSSKNHMARVNCATFALILAIFLRCSLAHLAIVDDTDPRLNYYSPNDAWTVRTGVASNWSLHQNTDTFVGIQGASVTFANFTGSLIEYWGNRGPSHGPCNITVDDAFVGVVNGHDTQTTSPILLFRMTDLDPQRNHTIVVTVVNASKPNICEVDRFVFSPISSSAPPISPDTLSNPDNSPLPTSLLAVNQRPLQKRTFAKRSNSTAIGIGIGVGVAVGTAVSCAGVLLWVYYWRKRKRSASGPEMASAPPIRSDIRIIHGPIPSAQPPVSPDTDLGHNHVTTHSETRHRSWVEGDTRPVTHGPSSISSYSQSSEQDDPEASQYPELRKSKPLPPTPHSSYRPVTGRALSHLTSLPSQYSGSTAVTGATPGMILSQLATFDDQRDLDTSSGKYRFTATSDRNEAESPSMPEAAQPDDAIFGSVSRATRGARR
ncbi:hypothetical protein BOTBODRAFT_170098 [Botryobasidium botryosum FD-172 SS1]|uniref:Mid2 domain-containing protein n=1 Tax=Botryobasidium botryosum (strain FD-172 SS1) TaxID=930990 RepID=A0A067MZE4_BOTB1|nr:hypothetical protein BOTBODRAFT_170098 [Botryobasidium botryosum FD-172 SS1]